MLLPFILGASRLVLAVPQRPERHDPPLPTLRCGYFVPKSHSNATTRFVLVAGLEGSGVHALSSVVSRHCSACVPWAGVRLFDAFIMTGTRHEEAAVRRHILESFAAHASNDAGKLVVLPPDDGIFEGHWSPLPPGVREHRLVHPNLHLLAALAEVAGVDLRIAVIDRAAALIAASLGANMTGQESDVIADNAAVL